MAKTFTLLSPTQHWRLIGGVWHRDWVARRADGALRLVAMPDEVAA